SVSDADISSFIANFKGASVSFEPESEVRAPEPLNNAAPSGEDVRVSPIARRLAESLGVDLAKVTGTGRNGRISKEDVESYAARMHGSQAPATPLQSALGTQPGSEQPATSAAQEGDANPPTIVRMSATRSTIAKRLLESKQTIPHYRLTVDVQIGPLQARRAELTDAAGRKITLNDMLVRAAAVALVQHPVVNSQFDGEQIRRYAHA